MAWTTPETFTAGQTLTAASMNAISDNLDAVGGAWTSYTPTWTNLTVGTSTQDFKYLNAGKLYVVRFKVTLAAGFSISGSPEFSLPQSVTANAGYIGTSPWGLGFVYDVSGPAYMTFIVPGTGVLDRARFAVLTDIGTHIAFGGVNATTPATWAAGDIFSGQFMFEAA